LGRGSTPTHSTACERELKPEVDFDIADAEASPRTPAESRMARPRAP
jgi:hypothetical protein